MDIKSMFSEQTIRQLSKTTSMSLMVNCLLLVSTLVTIWLINEVRKKQNKLIKLQSN